MAHGRGWFADYVHYYLSTLFAIYVITGFFISAIAIAYIFTSREWGCPRAPNASEE